MAIWSIERALKYGYVIDPHVSYADFSGNNRWSHPSHVCAVRNASYREPYDRIAPACANQCDECKNICHMNDYIRGKSHCPPHYPVPALLQDSQSNLAERWSGWLDADRLNGHKY